MITPLKLGSARMITRLFRTVQALSVRVRPQIAGYKSGTVHFCIYRVFTRTGTRRAGAEVDFFLLAQEVAKGRRWVLPSTANKNDNKSTASPGPPRFAPYFSYAGTAFLWAHYEAWYVYCGRASGCLGIACMSAATLMLTAGDSVGDPTRGVTSFWHRHALAFLYAAIVFLSLSRIMRAVLFCMSYGKTCQWTTPADHKSASSKSSSMTNVSRCLAARMMPMTAAAHRSKVLTSEMKSTPRLPLRCVRECRAPFFPILRSLLFLI